MGTISDLNKSLHVSTAGMTVQNKRMLIISQNLANANVKANSPNEQPYQRKTVSFANKADAKTGIQALSIKSVGVDTSPFREVYSPGDPAANEKGFVQMPNVYPMMEMMDMREAGLSHEANLRAYEKTLRMMEETVSLLRN